MPPSTLPCIHFDTDDLPPELRFPYFRQAMSVTFDISLHETQEADFSLQANIIVRGTALVISH